MKHLTAIGAIALPLPALAEGLVPAHNCAGALSFCGRGDGDSDKCVLRLSYRQLGWPACPLLCMVCCTGRANRRTSHMGLRPPHPQPDG